jgi:hypothetical protein
MVRCLLDAAHAQLLKQSMPRRLGLSLPESAQGSACRRRASVLRWIASSGGTGRVLLRPVGSPVCVVKSPSSRMTVWPVPGAAGTSTG